MIERPGAGAAGRSASRPMSASTPWWSPSLPAALPMTVAGGLAIRPWIGRPCSGDGLHHRRDGDLHRLPHRRRRFAETHAGPAVGQHRGRRAARRLLLRHHAAALADHAVLAVRNARSRSGFPRDSRSGHLHRLATFAIGITAALLHLRGPGLGPSNAAFAQPFQRLNLHQPLRSTPIARRRLSAWRCCRMALDHHRRRERSRGAEDCRRRWRVARNAVSAVTHVQWRTPPTILRPQDRGPRGLPGS